MRVMKFQFYSDQNLESPNRLKHLLASPLILNTKIFIIARDIYYLDRGFSKLDFINKVSKDFKHVCLIPSN